jgi:hypothetical protein
MIWLIFAHFIGDVAFQPDWVLKSKKDNWIVLLEHCFVWATMVSLVLFINGNYSNMKALFLIIGHYLIDLLKIRSTSNPLSKRHLLLDQLLHFIQLLIVW